MPIPWLAVLKIVPWTDVITNAPKVVDGAKKLWSGVRGKPAVQAPPTGSSDHASVADGSERAAIARLQGRIAALEAASADLHSQMLASTELIQALAEQNTQLIKNVEDNRVRIQWLTRATLVFGLIALLGLVLALTR